MSHLHHRVQMTWTDSDRDISLARNMLKQFFGARLHAVHVGDGMFAVHVVHYIEVAHFIIRGTTADKTEKHRGLISHLLYAKRVMAFILTVSNSAIPSSPRPSLQTQAISGQYFISLCSSMLPSDPCR